MHPTVQLPVDGRNTHRTRQGRTRPRLPNQGAQAQNRANANALSVGDRVSHPVFGQGTVLSTRQMAADTLIEVAFDTVGTKKLMATYAKLRRV